MIVIGHTRELAFQISKEYARFGKYLPQGTYVTSRVIDWSVGWLVH